MVPRCLEQAQSAHHIGPGKGERITDAPVHMRLGGKMDDSVHIFGSHQGTHQGKVAYVRLHELVVRAALHIPEIGKIAGIGQLVDIDDPVVGIFAYKKPDDVAADESGSARDDYVSLEFHCLTVI